MTTMVTHRRVYSHAQQSSVELLGTVAVNGYRVARDDDIPAETHQIPTVDAELDTGVPGSTVRRNQAANQSIPAASNVPTEGSSLILTREDSAASGQIPDRRPDGRHQAVRV